MAKTWSTTTGDDGIRNCYILLGGVWFTLWKPPCLLCSLQKPDAAPAKQRYILSLALSDTLQALFTIPLSVGKLATSEWHNRLPSCYFMVISMLSLASTSIFTMALMAMNRYYKIVKPAKYHNKFAKKFIIVTGSIAWILPILNSTLTVLAFGFDVSPHPGLAICKIELKKFYFPVLIIFRTRHFLPLCSVTGKFTKL